MLPVITALRNKHDIKYLKQLRKLNPSQPQHQQQQPQQPQRTASKTLVGGH